MLAHKPERYGTCDYGEYATDEPANLVHHSW